jgi:integrase
MGMRISEAMSLERDDVDLDAGVLTVRLTKFGKSRLVPLHPTPEDGLRRQGQRRRLSELELVRIGCEKHLLLGFDVGSVVTRDESGRLANCHSFPS